MLFTIVSIFGISTLMILITSLYVAGEFAAVSARKSRIVQEAQAGNRLAKMLLPVISDPHKLDSYIAASQVGITLSSIVLGVYGQQRIVELLQPEMEKLSFLDEVTAAAISTTLVLIVLTTLHVVLGELVPKSIALRYPEKMALATAIPMRWSSDLLLKPLIILLNGSGILVLKLLGIEYTGEHQHVHSPEEIKILIGESSEGGLINAEDRRLLDNAFRMGELTAEEVVVPRNRLVVVSVQTPIAEALKKAAESAYTRIPVYEDDIDHLIGFVHLKDLFRLNHRPQEEQELRSILRKAPYVPETMYANDVWLTMDKEDSYIAFVFDEYGGTTGMITREDLIEELIGEVQDEFDQEQAQITQVKPHQYVVRGDVIISYLNEQLNLELSNEFANTIGGLVLHELGRIPQVGDEVIVANIHFQVRAAGRAVHEILMTLPPTTLTPPDAEVE